VLVPPPGEHGSRDDYLQSVASGDLDYQAFEPTSAVNVRVSGTVAVVTYESHLEVTAGGIHVEHTAWHTRRDDPQHDREGAAGADSPEAGARSALATTSHEDPLTKNLSSLIIE